jgi:homocitrate synthase NifV
MKGIIDSTLREGEQTVGVLFSLQQKLDIVRRLSNIGVEEIEIGTVSSFDNDLHKLTGLGRRIKNLPQLAVWCRCHAGDIAIAASLQPDVLSLSIPVSDIHIEKKLGRNREWVLKTLSASIIQARELGIKKVSLGLEDATRADPLFLDEVVKTAEKSGADRIRLADTVGIAGPTEIVTLVTHIKQSTRMEIGVHMHNDFGMATANSLAALESGADWADSTVLGLGERAGNARLEELVGYLSLRRNRDYRTNELPELCRYVAHAADKTILPDHPIIGSRIFYCETGLHLQGLCHAPDTYEPFEPAKVGAERRLLFGKKIGKSVVKYHLAAMGSRVSADQLGEAVKFVRKKAEKLGRPLQNKEMVHLLSGLNT